MLALTDLRRRYGDEAVPGGVGAVAVLLVGTIVLLVPLVARVYEGAVLRMGRPLKLVEAWRAARA